MTTTHANDPSTPDTATTPPLCAALLEILNLFTPADGTITINVRSVSGIGHQRVDVPCGQAWRHLPMPLLTLLEDPLWHLRLNPAVQAGGHREALPALFATWRPVSTFDPIAAESRGQWLMPEKDAAAIAAALATLPLLPTVVIDGWTEVAALWALAEPLNLRRTETPRALHLLRRLAERLGADLAAAENLDVLLPLAGPVRGASAVDVPTVRIVELDTERVYDIATIERAIAGDGGATKKGAES